MNFGLIDESNGRSISLTLQFGESTLTMLIEFDPLKREWTLASRGLDFLDSVEVFNSAGIDFEDTRFDYGELRTVTFGALRGRWVIVVWTARGEKRRIISMRYANEREIAQYARRVGRPR
jgi:uncharacterized DUF497 family protein